MSSSLIRGKYIVCRVADDDRAEVIEDGAIFQRDGKIVEVQIRTYDMHHHAELGVAAHWRYKEGGTTRASFDQKIQFLRQLLEPTDRDGDLLDQIRGDIFEDRVYAVSPKGDVVEMPANSTPLDFA